MLMTPYTALHFLTQERLHLTFKEAIMADISKCLGEGCPDKERCVRYLEPAEPMWQSYGPFDFIRGEGECEHFWEVDEKDDE